MKIDEALNGLTGLNNNGGEMPRVRKAKKIKKITAGKKHKNFRKGPMNIDLSKLGEEEMENKDPILSKLKEKYASKKYAKTSDKNTMKVKPTTGHESPNKMRGKMVGEAPGEMGGMYMNKDHMATTDNPKDKMATTLNPKDRMATTKKPARQSTKADMQIQRDLANAARTVFNHEEFRKYMVQMHGNKTYAAVNQNLVKYQTEFQNAQNKARAEKELNKKQPDYSKQQEPITKRVPGLQAKIDKEMGVPGYNTKVSNNPIDSPVTRANQRANQKK